MFAQLGDLRFDHFYFQGIDADQQAGFATHERLGRKSRLQKTGLGLETLTIRVVFDHAFSDPEAQIAALKAIQAKQDPAVLLFGNGRVRGEFVIRSIGAATLDTDTQGGVLRAEVTLSLEEYADDDKAAAAARAAKAKAIALSPPGGGLPNAGNAKTLTPATLAASPPAFSDPAKIAKQAASTASKALTLLTLMGKAASDPSKLAAVAKEAGGLDTNLAPVATAIASGATAYQSVAGAANTVNRMRDLAVDVKENAEAGNGAFMLTAAGELRTLGKRYTRDMAPLAAATAARKV